MKYDSHAAQNMAHVHSKSDSHAAHSMSHARFDEPLDRIEENIHVQHTCLST